MLFISRHVSIFLIDFILYLCRSSWFRMEIDFVTHCHVVIFSSKPHHYHHHYHYRHHYYHHHHLHHHNHHHHNHLHYQHHHHYYRHHHQVGQDSLWADKDDDITLDMTEFDQLFVESTTTPLKTTDSIAGGGGAVRPASNGALTSR
jgi:hypothetical protein